MQPLTGGGGIMDYEKEIKLIEQEYPNWKSKFNHLVDAIKWHTKTQDEIIKTLRFTIEENRSPYIQNNYTINKRP